MSGSRAGPSVLFIDDDPAILQAAELLLGTRCELTVAASADEARAAIVAKRYDVVATDLSLPTARAGMELLEEIQQASPETKRVVITGAVGVSLPTGLADRVLRKPASAREILAAVLDHSSQTR